jgi:antitoxin CptB
MSEPETDSSDARRRRLLYRATHRGTYENDILLGGFVRRHLDALPESDLTALEALLEIPDNDLADWLTGRLPIPPEADSPMLRRVRDAAGHSLSREAGLDGEGSHPISPRRRCIP